MSDTLISRAIDRHGAAKVYRAACLRIGGDSSELLTVGLTAERLSDAIEIQTRAYERLNPSEQASDYWEAQQELRKLDDS